MRIHNLWSIAFNSSRSNFNAIKFLTPSTTASRNAVWPNGLTEFNLFNIILRLLIVAIQNPHSSTSANDNTRPTFRLCSEFNRDRFWLLPPINLTRKLSIVLFWFTAWLSLAFTFWFLLDSDIPIKTPQHKRQPINDTIILPTITAYF